MIRPEADAKRGPGRPPRGTKHTLSVRLTDAEWAAWQAKRAGHGLSLAELIRRAVAAYEGQATAGR